MKDIKLKLESLQFELCQQNTIQNDLIISQQESKIWLKLHAAKSQLMAMTIWSIHHLNQ